jgi:hypothetical protein
MVIIACHPAVGRQLTVGQAAGDVCIRCNRVGRDELLPGWRHRSTRLRQRNRGGLPECVPVVLAR